MLIGDRIERTPTDKLIPQNRSMKRFKALTYLLHGGQAEVVFAESNT